MFRTVLKYFAVITFSGALIWRTSANITNKNNDMSEVIKNQKEMKDDIKTIKEDLKVTKDSIVGISAPLRLQVQDLKNSMIDSKNAYNGLRTVVLDHTRKDPGMTLKQFEEYMESAPILKSINNPEFNIRVIPNIK
jgi:hypothetical protein